MKSIKLVNCQSYETQIDAVYAVQSYLDKYDNQKLGMRGGVILQFGHRVFFVYQTKTLVVVRFERVWDPRG